MEHINSNLKQTLPPQLTQVTAFSKTLAATVFITFPFIGFYLGRQYPEAPIQQNVSLPDPVPAPLYKKTLLGGEIPVSWSEYHAGDVAFIDTWPMEDSSHKHVLTGFASTKVSYGDWNASQIDVYIMTEKASNMYFTNAKEMAKTDPSVLIEEKKFDDVPVTVITWPLDNGEVTKGGTGGSSYIFKTNAYNSEPSYFIINKQARGDQPFEDSFAHFLDTLDFKKLQDSPWYGWTQ